MPVNWHMAGVSCIHFLVILRKYFYFVDDQFVKLDCSEHIWNMLDQWFRFEIAKLNIKSEILICWAGCV